MSLPDGEYQVWGTIPVCVKVTIEDGELDVTSVHALDEGFTVNGAVDVLTPGPSPYYFDQVHALTDGTDEVTTARLISEAVQNDNSMWPSWEWGW